MLEFSTSRQTENGGVGKFFAYGPLLYMFLIVIYPRMSFFHGPLQKLWGDKVVIVNEKKYENDQCFNFRPVDKRRTGASEIFSAYGPLLYMFLIVIYPRMSFFRGPLRKLWGDKVVNTSENAVF